MVVLVDLALDETGCRAVIVEVDVDRASSCRLVLLNMVVEPVRGDGRRELMQRLLEGVSQRLLILIIRQGRAWLDILRGENARHALALLEGPLDEAVQASFDEGGRSCVVLAGDSHRCRRLLFRVSLHLAAAVSQKSAARRLSRLLGLLL